ncbi:hypothetical protein GCM10023085_37260 [Actinomadura viridis]|uniref:GTPase n=1 Tax=Actinomadura viridis TaxID=58110 RepID=A0A931GHR9_9ACTN|nr:dynamin family protein [Actinomadura viridis]MBG6087738.1 putative GTPase [Actinomadura viridis]
MSRHVHDAAPGDGGQGTGLDRRAGDGRAGEEGLGVWNVQRARLGELFERTRAIAGDLEGGPAGPGVTARHSHTLDEAIKTLRRTTFRIMVFGDFSSGKSTLVNALLRAELLPMKENPTTAFTTVVGYGEVEGATLFQGLDPGSPGLQATISQFRQAVELRLDDRGLLVESPYLWGQVRGPYALLRDNVELIDSAGTNESPERENVTLAFLPQVDAIIFVTPARGAFKDRDVEHYLKMLADLGHKEIFFAVNQFDLIRPRDREDVRRRCRTIAESYARRSVARRLFFVSAYDALEARTAQTVDERLDRESGVQELEAALADFLVHDKARVKLLRPAELLGHQIAQLDKVVMERRLLLNRSADQLRETLDSSRDRRESLMQTLGHIRTGLNGWVAETEQLLAAELERFIRGLVPEVPRWMDRPPRLKLRPFKGDRMERYAGAIMQIDDVLNRRLQDELREFAGREDGPLERFMRKREEALERSVLPLLQDYAEHLEELRADLTGSRRPVDEGALREWLRDMSMHVPDRVLARTSPMLSWPNAAGAAGVGTAGAAAGAGLFALGLVSWIAAPVVLSAGAIVVVSARLAKRRLVERATGEYADALAGGAGRIAGQYTEECAEGLRAWTGHVESELAAELGGLIAATEEAIGSLEEGRSKVEGDRRQLDTWDTLLNGIAVELSEFKRPLIEDVR